MFYPYGALPTVRGLVDAAGLLADAGYSVDVYYRRTDNYLGEALAYPGVTFTDDQPAVFGLGPVRRPAALKHGRALYDRAVARGPHAWWRRWVFLPELRRRHARLPYVALIGLDWYGLTAAGPLAEALNVPFVYWSLELLFADDLPSPDLAPLKRLEAYWSRRAAFVVIQDQWRAAALVSENHIDPTRVVLVPNAPRGNARRRLSGQLRQKLGVDDSVRIVICSGLLRPWAMSLEVARAARTWPDGFLLYMQSKAMPNHDRTPYSDAVLQSALPGKVVIGLDPVPASDFRRLVDSADIGLALYNPVSPKTGRVDRNMQLMGYSSGKLADYLYSGLPVIVSSQPGLEDLVRADRCGVCVSTVESTAEALETISRDYATFSANAIACFDQTLELERHFGVVLERLESLT